MEQSQTIFIFSAYTDACTSSCKIVVASKRSDFFLNLYINKTITLLLEGILFIWGSSSILVVVRVVQYIMSSIRKSPESLYWNLTQRYATTKLCYPMIMNFIYWTSKVSQNMKIESRWKTRALSNGFLSDIWLVENDRRSFCWPISNRAYAIWLAARQNSFSPARRAFSWGQFVIWPIILMIIFISSW